MQELKQLIAAAAVFLDGKIRRTPLEPSPVLSQRLGVPVALKLESLQLTGSFKIRGAWFRLSRETSKEILPCSAGNHGKAAAYASRQLGLRAVICGRSSVDRAKHQGMLAMGAEVRLSPFAGYDETEDWAMEMAEREGLPFVSGFDDLAVMAGNGGTLAKETLEQMPEAQTCILPGGGGGLSARVATYAEGRENVGWQHGLSPGLPT